MRLNTVSVDKCLISFKTIVFVKKLDNKANLRSCPNFGVMLEDMLQLKNQLENFNDILSVTLLIKVITNSILLCSCVCAIDDLAKDPVVQWDCIIALSLLFLSQLFDETISCVASQRIANEMGSLIRAIQELTAQQCTEFLHLTANPRPPSASSYLLSSTNNALSGQCRAVEDVEYRCLQHICSMRDSFLYNVLNLFDLRSVTILAILSNVCNYSTILIQVKTFTFSCKSSPLQVCNVRLVVTHFLFFLPFSADHRNMRW